MSNIKEFKRPKDKTEISRDLSYITGATSYEEKKLCVGIPAYHAEKTLDDCLASILIQSIRDDILTVISPDDEDSYEYLKDRFPLLDIVILHNPEKNGGPGVARQRVLEYLYEQDKMIPYVTFIDADDVFLNAHSIESLMIKAYQFPKSACIQGIAAQELDGETYRRIQGLNPVQINPRDFHVANRDRYDTSAFQNPSSPWVFGKIYRTEYLKKNDITFGDLRAMEDGKFNHQLRLISAGTSSQTIFASEVVYLWRVGSEHSITRVGMRENNGTPIYSHDLCMVGSTVCFIDALYKVRKKLPMSQQISEQIAQHMMSHYVTFIESLETSPMFARQNLFNAKRWYRTMYKDIESQMTEDALFSQMTQAYIQLLSHEGKAPKYSFEEFMNIVKTEPYGGLTEWNDIRSELPKWVIDLDLKSGVLGEEGFIYCEPEKENGIDSYADEASYISARDSHTLICQK